jgi:succinyl-diaminopimelate desuccinylase
MRGPQLDPMNTIDLLKQLVGLDTINPPGNESLAAALLAPRLERMGLLVELHEIEPGRSCIVARLEPFDPDQAPICFTGHMDVVPLGENAWSRDPFAGELDGGRLFGRGASDMKGGVAAIVGAVEQIAHLPAAERKSGALVILTSGEESGCDGVRAMIERGLLSKARAGAIVVGEPTGLRPVTAHKGALWTRITCQGKAAHASTPELGDNAILKSLSVIERLRTLALGSNATTMNVGVIRGGTIPNQVPDRCETIIDLRTAAGADQAALFQRIVRAAGADAIVERLLDVAPLHTDASDVWVERSFALAERFLGERPRASSVNYFTDGALLAPFFGGPPTLICGPGDPDQAHQTDEHVEVSLVERAVDYYFELARAWFSSPTV